MKPKELADVMYERALEASDEEWSDLKESFRKLDAVGRIDCWNNALNKEREAFINPKDRIERVKVIHKHVSLMILDIFAMKPGEEGKSMKPTVPRSLEDRVPETSKHLLNWDESK